MKNSVSPTFQIPIMEVLKIAALWDHWWKGDLEKPQRVDQTDYLKHDSVTTLKQADIIELHKFR